MSEEKFRVVFTGKLKTGFEEHSVRAQLASQFNLDAPTLNKLFGGQRVTVTRNVTKATGQKFVTAFERAGALCELVPMTPSSPRLELEPLSAETAVEQPVATASADMTCPKCGFQQATSQECQRCGIIFAKYRPRDAAEVERAQSDTDQTHKPLRRTMRQDNVVATGPVAEFAQKVFYDWLRGNVFVAVIVLILLPIFGSGLIINAVFYTRDHHVLYEPDSIQLMCGDLDPEMGEPGPDMDKNIKPQDDAIAKQWHFDYAFTQLQDYLEDRDSRFCVVQYSINIGSIGDEIVDEVSVKFSDERFTSIFLDQQPLRHIHREVQNISSSSPRSQDPKFELLEPATLKITQFAPGTLIKLKIFGWYNQQQTQYNWDDLLESVNTSQGTIEPGDPRATGFARFITAVF